MIDVIINGPIKDLSKYISKRFNTKYFFCANVRHSSQKNDKNHYFCTFIKVNPKLKILVIIFNQF